jgi:pyruvate ferredoxin oxidoreductase gamma subunit
MPMLAAIVKITGIMEKEEFFKDMEDSLKHKFKNKEELIKGNLEAIKLAWDSVEKVR